MLFVQFSPPTRRAPLAVLVLLSGLAKIAQADPFDEDDARPPVVIGNPANESIERMTVTATKGTREISEVTSSVDIIGATQMDNELVRDIKDLVRYIPGVSVRQSAGRFGLSDFTIRGLSGNRVLIEVDGVRIADAFSIGSFSNANRNFVDLDSVKVVEILRGSASSLYGSNAIGGVVSFLTKDPEDYLQGSTFYSSLKAGYSDVDNSLTETLTSAIRSANFSAMMILSKDDGHEQKNQGRDSSTHAARTAANPQDIHSESLLAKLLWSFANDHKLRITGDWFNNETRTESYWSRTNTSVNVLDLDGNDQQRRERVQLDYEFASVWPGVHAGLFQLYQQKSKTKQHTNELRQSGTPPIQTERQREFQFEQRINGAELTLSSLWSFADIKHTFTYGLEYSRTESEQLRDGRARNLLTGVVTTVIMPDVFPVRDFPPTTTTEIGAYWQDEIELWDKQWLIVPAWRFDRYQLNSHNDAIFAEDNPHVSLVDLVHEHMSPKLGVLYKANVQHSFFAQYAEGFRAPPLADVNIGFTNMAFGYTAIPNADLQPETSQTFDIGWRFRDDWGFTELTLFNNRYEDFIDSLAIVSRPPITPLIVFQSQNVSDVSIEGIEFRAGLDLESLLNVNGTTLRFAWSHAAGKNHSNDQALNSVDPDKTVLGVAWDTPNQKVGFELVSTYVTAKKHVDNTAGALFTPGSYLLLDLLARWNPSEHFSVQAGVFNLTDELHWQWADVRGQPLSNTALDRYSSPGRNAAVNVHLRF